MTSRFSLFCVAVSLTLCALVGALGFVTVQLREVASNQQSAEVQLKEDHDTLTRLERKLGRVASKMNDGNRSLVDLIDDLEEQRNALKVSARRHNAKLERLLGRLRVDSNGTLSARGRAPLPHVDDPPRREDAKEDAKDHGGGESVSAAALTPNTAARADETPRAPLQRSAAQDDGDDDEDDEGDDEGKTGKRAGTKQSGSSSKKKAKERKKRRGKHG